MNFVRNLEALCCIGGREPFKCTGTITVENQEGNNIYASWSMRDENGTNLGGRSRSYFFKEGLVDEERVLASVLQNIIDFRVDRERIFSYVIIKPSAHSHNT